MLRTLKVILLITAALSGVRATSSDNAGYTRVDTWRRRDMVAVLGPQLSSNASIVFPDQAPQWTNVTERWTKFQAPSFRAAVQVANEEDVVAVIKYATKRHINFFTQTGGHAFAPLNTVQEAIMIQMRQLSSLSIDQTTGLATVGGGVIYQELINATFEAGREVTVGSCPCVGFLGAGLGGGIGRLQGLHGLSQDAFRRFRVVLANGTSIDVSSSENSDLWWAMRGAGHNFGVVVEAEVQTFPQASAGLFYNADLTLRSDQLEAALALMNRQIPHMPAELAVEILFAIDSKTLDQVLSINIVYAGDTAAARRWSAPWKRLGPTTFAESVVNWRDLPTKTAGGSKEVDCLNYGYKDIYSVNLRTFDIPTMRAAYDSFGALVKANPNANISSILFEVYSQEGVRAHPTRDSAFPHRKVMNILTLIFGWWTDAAISNTMDQWLGETRAAMNSTSGYDDLYLYMNYARSEPLQTYFGYEPWRLQKLQALKRKYDPQNQFFGYHGITPSSGNSAL